MVLNVTGSPTLLNCLTLNCTSINFSTLDLGAELIGGKWRDRQHARRCACVASCRSARRRRHGRTSTSSKAARQSILSSALECPLVKAGTFQITDTNPATGIATIVCQDGGVFAYNNTGGNCTGANVASSFVNYQTGDYQITFTSGHAPLSGHAITASWTNIISPESNSSFLNRPQGIDFFGDNTGPQSGADAAMFAKAPGGVNGHIYSGLGTDWPYIINGAAASNVGYQWGGIGYSQMVSWLFSARNSPP